MRVCSPLCPRGGRLGSVCRAVPPACRAVASRPGTERHCKKSCEAVGDEIVLNECRKGLRALSDAAGRTAEVLGRAP